MTSLEASFFQRGWPGIRYGINASLNLEPGQVALHIKLDLCTVREGHDSNSDILGVNGQVIDNCLDKIFNLVEIGLSYAAWCV